MLGKVTFSLTVERCVEKTEQGNRFYKLRAAGARPPGSLPASTGPAPARPHLHPLRLVDTLLVAANVEGVLHVEQLVHLPRGAGGRAGGWRGHTSVPLTAVLPERHVDRKQKSHHRALWEM